MAFRLTEEERAVVEAIARYESKNVASLVHERVVPWAKTELARRLLVNDAARDEG